MSEKTKEYDEEKRKIAVVIAGRLVKRFPGFQAQIEVVDVVMPISVEHWTSAYRGCCVPYLAPKHLARK